MADAQDRYARGMATRRAVLGERYVDAAVANTDPFTADFQKLITESAWGTVWARDTISRRERSMLTIALLAALGHHDEVAMHVRATRNTGASMDDIKEALLHVAIYAGVPAANHAFKVARAAYAEMQDDKAG
ncbi:MULTISPECIES: 4-carboxymuconolactone decarboxylase [Bosea]|uniref:4-carboxymuconolactone decarboxylase n=1 Tax=Bosea minatitlanensis TaxID=128782 RepID=A0ABW0EYY3_9HYPH|nr:4-carboxymuconolactone decarboxylase [Bosea minatitlanensis]MCT4495478.1 4-carboxymuconolactone decarboxylase [Bosea minatitlanensis]